MKRSFVGCFGRLFLSIVYMRPQPTIRPKTGDSMVYVIQYRYPHTIDPSWQVSALQFAALARAWPTVCRNPANKIATFMHIWRRLSDRLPPLGPLKPAMSYKVSLIRPLSASSDLSDLATAGSMPRKPGIFTSYHHQQERRVRRRIAQMTITEHALCDDPDPVVPSGEPEYGVLSVHDHHCGPSRSSARHIPRITPSEHCIHHHSSGQRVDPISM